MPSAINGILYAFANFPVDQNSSLTYRYVHKLFSQWK